VVINLISIVIYKLDLYTTLTNYMVVYVFILYMI